MTKVFCDCCGESNAVENVCPTSFDWQTGKVNGRVDSCPKCMRLLNKIIFQFISKPEERTQAFKEYLETLQS